MRCFIAEKLAGWMLTLNSMKIRYERQTLPETGERRDGGVAAAAANAFHQLFAAHQGGGGTMTTLPRKAAKALVSEIDKIRNSLIENQLLKQCVWNLLTQYVCFAKLIIIVNMLNRII